MILASDPNKTTQLLLVEDSDSDIRLMQIYLEETGSWFELCVAKNMHDALVEIDRHPFDVVLLDLNLPDSRGQQGIQSIKRSLPPHTAIVVITETADPDLALRMMAVGAQDYLTKSELSSESIRRAVMYAIERNRYIEEIERYKNNLVQLVEERTSELNESRELYRILAAASPVGLFRTNADDQCIYVNEMWTRITGWTEQDTLGHPWWQSVHQADRAECERAWMAFVEGRDDQIFQRELRMVSPSGGTMWINVKANKIDYTNDVGTVGTVSDITRTKGLLDQLKQLRD